MKNYLLLMVLMVFGQAVLAQKPFNVSGRVMDLSTGRSIPGVTVRAVVANVHTTTDDDGRFSLSLSKFPDTLVVHHLGYHGQQVAVTKANSAMEIYLHGANEMLEEVLVNTGYQTLRPNEVTGAVQVLGSADLEQQVGTNILQRLDNMAVGVRFDNQPIPGRQQLNVSVRGLSTIEGPLDPLIVLDGFIYEGDIENIDPNSIASITILKDAAATSIWGARAGNGVIVLTTKRGGLGSGKARVSFNKTTIIREKPDLNQLYELPVADFIKIEELLFENGYYERQIRRTPYAALTPATEIFLRRREGLITAADSATAIQRLQALDGKAAYTDLFYSNPLVDQYAIGISGGNANYTYGFNGGYTTDKDAKSAQGRKLNLHLVNSFRPIEKLSIDVNTYYTHSKTLSGKPDYDHLKYGDKQIPYLELVDDEGSPLPVDLTFRSPYMEEHYGGHYFSWQYYPIEDWRQSQSSTITEELFSNANIRYSPFPFLNLNLSGQYQLQRKEGEQLHHADSYYARTMVNQFSEFDPVTGNVAYHIPKGGIRQLSTGKGSSYTLRGQANVQHRWLDYRLTGIVGAEVRQNKRESNEFTVYGYDDDPLTSVRVDHVNSFRTVPNLGSSSIAGAPRFFQTINRFMSLYTNWAFTFKERYSLSASMRRDGANIFGALTNDKWSPFWHLGATWDLAKEPFYRSELAPSLKLRATYGYSGNVDLAKTPLPIGSTTSGRYTNYPAIAISTLNDPTLRWEKIGTLNFGLDFALKGDRLTGSVDYYVKKGKDLYGLAAYDYTVWGRQGTITKNTASMRSSGLDILLNSKNLRRKVGWDTRYIISLNRNKTTEYYSRFNTDLISMLGSGVGITPIIGRPLNAISAYKWAGLDDQGNPQGYVNGQPSVDYTAIRAEAIESGADETNVVYVGSSKPQWFGALINTFSYKAFSLSVNISFKADYYFQNNATSYSRLFETGTAYPDVATRWKQPGDEMHTNMPSLQYPAVQNRDSFYGMAEIHVLRGDHIRLEYINLAWHPEWNIGNRIIQSEIYANLSNLGVLWSANKHKLDPEFANRLSPLRSLALGVRFNL